jgi:DNA modification methylase
MTYYTDPLVTLLHGDCIEVLPTLEADSVDAVVTDPPYGLEFMGKDWDGFRKPSVRDQQPGSAHNGTTFLATRNTPEYRAGHPFQVWCEQWGREALRVTKPGGYLLAFGGTRTHHRLVCALEDAGWIIRDELDWIYASGFPKGKANLKPAHEPIVLARKPGPLRPLAIDAARIGTGEDKGNFSGNWGMTPDRGWNANSVPPRGSKSSRLPAHPGAGATPTDDDPHTPLSAWPGVISPPSAAPEQSSTGRWPSNVLLSDPELFDQPNPYVVGSGATQATRTNPDVPNADAGMFGLARRQKNGPEYLGDSGGYSRFFIVPKADRAERERGLTDFEKKQVGGRNRADGRQWDIPGSTIDNNKPPRSNHHPTVKPIDLMRHLVRLVTPPGGTVLDPFLGSGTTAIACEMEGFAWIGIEREAEYLEIARARITASPRGLGL